MKKLILILLFFISFGTQAYADSYLLVMSKDDEIAQHMYQLINGDMKEHGRIVFENHKEYNWIKWDRDINMYDYDSHLFDPDSSMDPRISRFDINNDGKDETVLFYYSVIKVFMDHLSYYPIEYYQKFKKKIYYSELPETAPKIFGGESYPLKELPAQPIDPPRRSKYKLLHYINIGGQLFIRPLKIKSQYFISLFGSYWQGYPQPPIDKGNIIVIGQYDANNNFTEICYFIRTNIWKNRGDK